MYRTRDFLSVTSRNMKLGKKIKISFGFFSFKIFFKERINGKFHHCVSLEQLPINDTLQIVLVSLKITVMGKKTTESKLAYLSEFLSHSGDFFSRILSEHVSFFWGYFWSWPTSFSMIPQAIFIFDHLKKAQKGHDDVKCQNLGLFPKFPKLHTIDIEVTCTVIVSAKNRFSNPQLKKKIWGVCRPSNFEKKIFFRLQKMDV